MFNNFFKKSKEESKSESKYSDNKTSFERIKHDVRNILPLTKEQKDYLPHLSDAEKLELILIYNESIKTIVSNI